MTDVFGVSSSQTAYIRVRPASVPATDGPTAVITAPASVNVTSGANATVALSSSGSNCTAPACAYLWTVQCPSGTAKTYTLPSLLLVAGPGGDFDTTGQTAAFACNVTLTLTDANNKTGSAQTLITIT